MRKLNLTDVFRFSRLVKAAGLKGVIRDVLKTAAEAKQNRKRPLRIRHPHLADLLFVPALFWAWLYLGFAVCDIVTREFAAEGSGEPNYTLIGGEVVTLLESQQQDDSVLYAAGIDGFMTIIEAAAEKGVETAVYEFLAPVWEMSKEQLAETTLETVIANLQQMFAENDMMRFFKQSEALTR